MSQFEQALEEGIFPHKCKQFSCERVVQYDDEPYCFTHSPDSGSSQRGYSARAEAHQREIDQDRWGEAVEPF